MRHRRMLGALLFASALALAGCGGDEGSAAGAGDGDIASLPGPESDGGSVTGMPDRPGPGPVGPPSGGQEQPADAALADDGSLVFPVDGDAAAGDAMQPAGAGEPAPVPASPAAEPTPDEAVAVVQAYYAAIDARQYARAHGLWSGGGSASGQSPEQFASGFSDTTGVVVEAGAPGRVEAAAGSRFVQVPVAVRATRADGSVHRYAGNYTLRRAVVDGASAEQRAWRIASADIREVR
jgi:hypothetical protein